MDRYRRLTVVTLLVWYIVFSIAMAIHPASRQFWIAANVLPILFVIVLALTHSFLPLSTRSYVLIAIFLTLHTIGVHYTYSRVPFGSWLQHALHSDRNQFDRIVHFSFGFLLTYPLEELFRLTSLVRGWLVYYLPVMTILGLSGLWEILESWAARLFKPDLGLTFLGSQGDIWDAQKDMTSAFYGSLVCMTLIVLVRRFGAAPELSDSHDSSPLQEPT